MNNRTEIESVVKSGADPSLVRFVPYGSADEIKLSIKIVQDIIAVPTKSGATCSRRDALKFIAMCQARKLNPFEGDAFLVGYDGKNGPEFSLITAHQAFLKRAEIHPEFDGMKSGIIVLRNEETGETIDIEGDFHLPTQTVVGGWATVYFKNRTHPINRRIRLERFNKGYAQWRDDPAGMIVKCFDEETEVLTTMGFERFANAEGRILQVTDGGLEPTESVPFVQPYGGLMIEWASRNGNFRVTPNHDLPLAINGESEAKVEARHILDMRQRDDVLMPLSAKFARLDYPVDDDTIRIAAAYIADGSDNSRSSGFAIAVSREHKVEMLREIGGYISERAKADGGDSVKASSGRVITTRADKRCFYYSRTDQLDWIVTRGKNIQRDAVLALSQRQAKLFVDTWLRMDGGKPSNCRIGRIYTSRPDHVRAFEVAACLAGYSVSERRSRKSDIGGRNWYLTVTDRTHINLGLSRQLIRTSNNEGAVWCITVPTGKIIVRRRGFSAVCHNCAEADALRSSFPTMLGGLYMKDEISLDVGAGKRNDSDAVSLVQMVNETTRRPAPQPNGDEEAEAAAGLAPAAGERIPPGEEKPPTNSCQDQLAAIVVNGGSNFEEWRAWALEEGHLEKKHADLPGFDLVPDAVCVRLIRAKTGMLQALGKRKVEA